MRPQIVSKRGTTTVLWNRIFCSAFPRWRATTTAENAHVLGFVSTRAALRGGSRELVEHRVSLERRDLERNQRKDDRRCLARRGGPQEDMHLAWAHVHDLPRPPRWAARVRRTPNRARSAPLESSIPVRRAVRIGGSVEGRVETFTLTPEQ